MSANPRTPAGLAASGRKLWRAVSGEYELDVHEQLLLLQAARCADRLDVLAEAASTSPLTTNYKGDPVTNPAIVESRQQSLTLARLLASLRLPSGDEEDMARPQRRGAVRGSYGIRSVS